MVPGQTNGGQKYPSYWADPSDPTGSLQMAARPKTGWKRKRVWLPVAALIALVVIGVGGIGAAVGVKKKSSNSSKSSSDAPSASVSSTDIGTSGNRDKLPTQPTGTEPKFTYGPSPYGSPEHVHSLPFTHSVEPKSFDYAFDEILGDSFLFYEAQRSGALSKAPGGNRISWRGDQLLDDGADVGLDLAGGSYEAGNRLKVTQASAYYISRTAISCALFRGVYSNVKFDGETMMHWCKREVRWGADWLLKTHVRASKGNEGASKWEVGAKGDKFVAMVGAVPGDWRCYRRAESMPSEPLCTEATRETLLATSDDGAADAAGEAAAALAATAVLFQDEDFSYALKCLATAHALMEFAELRPVPLKQWAEAPKLTYPSSNAQQYLLWGAVVLTWAHTCGTGETEQASCNKVAAAKYQKIVDQMWRHVEIIDRHKYYKVSNWDNPVFDAALMMTITTGNVNGPYAEVVHDFVSEYVKANGTADNGVGHTPQGLRTFKDENWASLRMAVTASSIAATYASMAHVDAETAMHARCLARSQLRYVAGDTGRSYVVGFGKKFPTQVHHRDACCTLEEDAAGICAGGANQTKAFQLDRPNPHVITGALVGGPDAKDNYIDQRARYHYTEVALDYNAGLSAALAALMAAPTEFWDSSCEPWLPNYPWKENAS